MQKIAFTIFEIAKQTFKQNLPQDQILQLIEHHVKKAWEDSINELKDRNLIDEGLREKAARQSNIDSMMQNMQEDQQAQQAQSAASSASAPPAAAQQQPAASVPVNSNQPAQPIDLSKPIEPYKPPKLLKPVSYTHLDVYKRQRLYKIKFVRLRKNTKKKLQL